MNKLLGSIINKFDAEAKSHMERQSLNPFSGNFSRSPSPRLSKDQYGRPLAGSKTEERGQKAKCHILREIQDLCNCIHDLGVYNKTHKPNNDSDDEAEHNDDEIIITFGEIFQMYTNINDKVVGLLIAAKKRGFLYFEKEILFQRRDDDVLIALMKPIKEIRATINSELAAAKSPIAFQSRDASPAVGDTDSDKKSKVNGNHKVLPKSGSGSPVKNDRSGTPNASSNGTAVIETEEPVVLSSTELGKDEVNKDVNEKPHDDKEISKEEAKTSEDTNISPLVPNENINDVVDLKEKEEAQSDAIEVAPSVPLNEVVEECAIPTVDVTCDEVSPENDITETTSDNIANPSTESIPIIEITKAATPERGTSEEPITVNDEADNKDQNTNETNSNMTCYVVESKITDDVDIVDNSTKSFANVADLSPVVPEEEEKVVQPVMFDDLVDKYDFIQDSRDPVIDNERKRTFSNEELIESLAAALSGRSSSPDICDEEVEQIFQSQAAIAPLLNEAEHINTMTLESDIPNQGNTTPTTNIVNTSEEPMGFSPNMINAMTPENLVSEDILPSLQLSNFDLTENIVQAEETNKESIASLSETNESFNKTEINNLEGDLPTIDDIVGAKVSTPEINTTTSYPEATETEISNIQTEINTPETEISNTEINESVPETFINVMTPTPETEKEGNSSA